MPTPSTKYPHFSWCHTFNIWTLIRHNFKKHWLLRPMHARLWCPGCTGVLVYFYCSHWSLFTVCAALTFLSDQTKESSLCSPWVWWALSAHKTSLLNCYSITLAMVLMFWLISVYYFNLWLFKWRAMILYCIFVLKST